MLDMTVPQNISYKMWVTEHAQQKDYQSCRCAENAKSLVQLCQIASNNAKRVERPKKFQKF